MSDISDRGNRSQGEGGARKGSSGDHMNPKGEGRIHGKGSSGSKFDQHPNVKAGPQGGSHLDQGQAHGSPRAPQRGGHSKEGYDHTQKTGKSGSKNAQNPGFPK